MCIASLLQSQSFCEILDNNFTLKAKKCQLIYGNFGHIFLSKYQKFMKKLPPFIQIFCVDIKTAVRFSSRQSPRDVAAVKASYSLNLEYY